MDTSASFSVAGTYVLRLTADDGAFSPTDDVTDHRQPGGAQSGARRQCGPRPDDHACPRARRSTAR